MPELPAEIAQLQERYQRLQKQKDENAGRLQLAEESLAKLKQEAKERFGADDLDELRRKLNEMEESNLQKRKEYEALLNQIEADLKTVEQEFSE